MTGEGLNPSRCSECGFPVYDGDHGPNTLCSRGLEKAIALGWCGPGRDGLHRDRLYKCGRCGGAWYRGRCVNCGVTR